jgi:hypothetical protein
MAVKCVTDNPSRVSIHYTNLEIKKPYADVQYNKFMKVIDRADQYLS